MASQETKFTVHLYLNSTALDKHFPHFSEAFCRASIRDVHKGYVSCICPVGEELPYPRIVLKYDDDRYLENIFMQEEDGGQICPLFVGRGQIDVRAAQMMYIHYKIIVKQTLTGAMSPYPMCTHLGALLTQVPVDLLNPELLLAQETIRPKTPVVCRLPTPQDDIYQEDCSGLFAHLKRSLEGWTSQQTVIMIVQSRAYYDDGVLDGHVGVLIFKRTSFIDVQTCPTSGEDCMKIDLSKCHFMNSGVPFGTPWSEYRSELRSLMFSPVVLNRDALWVIRTPRIQFGSTCSPCTVGLSSWVVSLYNSMPNASLEQFGTAMTAWFVDENSRETVFTHISSFCGLFERECYHMLHIIALRHTKDIVRYTEVRSLLVVARAHQQPSKKLYELVCNIAKDAAQKIIMTIDEPLRIIECLDVFAKYYWSRAQRARSSSFKRQPQRRTMMLRALQELEKRSGAELKQLMAGLSPGARKTWGEDLTQLMKLTDRFEAQGDANKQYNEVILVVQVQVSRMKKLREARLGQLWHKPHLPFMRQMFKDGGVPFPPNPYAEVDQPQDQGQKVREPKEDEKRFANQPETDQPSSVPSKCFHTSAATKSSVSSPTYHPGEDWDLMLFRRER